MLLLAARGLGLLALHIYAQEKSESTSKDERESGYMMACSIAAFLLHVRLEEINRPKIMC